MGKLSCLSPLGDGRRGEEKSDCIASEQEPRQVTTTCCREVNVMASAGGRDVARGGRTDGLLVRTRLLHTDDTVRSPMCHCVGQGEKNVREQSDMEPYDAN